MTKPSQKRKANAQFTLQLQSKLDKIWKKTKLFGFALLFPNGTSGPAQIIAPKEVEWVASFFAIPEIADLFQRHISSHQRQTSRGREDLTIFPQKYPTSRDTARIYVAEWCRLLFKNPKYNDPSAKPADLPQEWRWVPIRFLSSDELWRRSEWFRDNGINVFVKLATKSAEENISNPTSSQQVRHEQEHGQPDDHGEDHEDAYEDGLPENHGEDHEDAYEDDNAEGDVSSEISSSASTIHGNSDEFFDIGLAARSIGYDTVGITKPVLTSDSSTQLSPNRFLIPNESFHVEQGETQSPPVETTPARVEALRESSMQNFASRDNQVDQPITRISVESSMKFNRHSKMPQRESLRGKDLNDFENQCQTPSHQETTVHRNSLRPARAKRAPSALQEYDLCSSRRKRKCSSKENQSG